MYLEFLEKNGVNVKDLAVKRLAMKTHQPESMVSALITSEFKDDDAYRFLTLEYTYDGMKEVVNSFTDHDYFVGYNDNNEYFEIDRDWVSLVYSELCKVDEKESNKYKSQLIFFIDNALSKHKLSRVMDITDINGEEAILDSRKREKEYKKLEARAKIIKEDFKRIFENASTKEEERGL